MVHNSSAGKKPSAVTSAPSSTKIYRAAHHLLTSCQSRKKFLLWQMYKFGVRFVGLSVSGQVLSLAADTREVAEQCRKEGFILPRKSV